METSCWYEMTSGVWRIAWYRLIRGRLYRDACGSRVQILSFCLDDPDQGPVVELPIFMVLP